jgi:hypothetical protein
MSIKSEIKKIKEGEIKKNSKTMSNKKKQHLKE